MESRQQQQHAALAVVGQGVQVEQFVVGGSGVDLEIAGVDDDAERGGDGQRDRAHDRVGDVDELDLERADRRWPVWASPVISRGSFSRSYSSRRRSTSARVKAVP